MSFLEVISSANAVQADYMSNIAKNQRKYYTLHSSWNCDQVGYHFVRSLHKNLKTY